MKKLTPWFLAAVAPALALGCSGTTFIGHFAVVLVTLGIFVGTLSMGRQARLGNPSSCVGEKQSGSITTSVDERTVDHQGA